RVARSAWWARPSGYRVLDQEPRLAGHDAVVLAATHLREIGASASRRIEPLKHDRIVLHPEGYAPRGRPFRGPPLDVQASEVLAPNPRVGRRLAAVRGVLARLRDQVLVHAKVAGDRRWHREALAGVFVEVADQGIAREDVVYLEPRHEHAPHGTGAAPRGREAVLDIHDRVAAAAPLARAGKRLGVAVVVGYVADDRRDAL